MQTIPVSYCFANNRWRQSGGKAPCILDYDSKAAGPGLTLWRTEYFLYMLGIEHASSP
jgi:hypothetical protein